MTRDLPPRHAGPKRTLMMMLAALGLLASVAPSTASAKRPPKAPEMSMLASFGSGLGSGSTVGPGGALYVTDGNAGSVLRVDPETGDVTTFAEGLPAQVLGIGGAMDVAFIGRTAYVLVTLVGGDIVGGPHIGDARVGIYRLEKDGSFKVIADIGAWSISHPPATDFFITTGVQYAVQTFRGGFLVTDGHHNRVLRVKLNGEISELIAFGNIVPTGLETFGPAVLMAEAGPLPHLPEDGKVVAFGPWAPTVVDVANGASLLVDVELGRGLDLYALSQGQWDGVAEGSPAAPDTGRLVKVDWRGALVPIVDGDGNELVLDRPTSLELIGNTAYVVGLTGTIVKIENL
jgi:hypothetical protein